VIARLAAANALRYTLSKEGDLRGVSGGMSTFAKGLLAALVIGGFHTGVTLLALYRAWQALRAADAEARNDRSTLYRVAWLRLVAGAVFLTGGLLTLLVPLCVVGQWGLTFLPTFGSGTALLIAGAWVVWVPAMFALERLARRWLPGDRWSSDR
jgi:hypothetical protein